MGMGSFVGASGTLAHLQWERMVREFARVERLQRLYREKRMGPDVDFFALCDEAEAAHPFLTPAQLEELPLPVWITAPLTCEGCGTISGRSGHIEGTRITGCSNCTTSPKMSGGRRAVQIVRGGAAPTED